MTFTIPHIARTIEPKFHRMLWTAVRMLDAMVWGILGWAGGPTRSPRRTVITLGSIHLVVIVCGLTLTLIVPALPIGWLFGEGDPITVSSALALIGCASIANRICVLRENSLHGSPSLPTVMWRLFVYCFVFLAVDELLRIHETFDRYVHKLLGIRPTGISDHLDDFIVGLYGIVILVVMFKNRSEVLRYLSAGWYCAFSFFLGAISVALDFLASAKWYWRTLIADEVKIQMLIDVLDVVEEVSKLYAEFLFIGALMVCWHIAEAMMRQGFPSYAGGEADAPSRERRDTTSHRL